MNNRRSRAVGGPAEGVRAAGGMRGVYRSAPQGRGDRDRRNIDSPAYSDVREMLDHLSRSRTVRGCSPSETASFVFSLKRPLFNSLRRETNGDGEALADAIWSTNVLLDKLGLYTIEVYQKTREELINRQQAEMLELSTPVVKLWDGILGLPMIGTLDSARTQIVMESSLAEDRRDGVRDRDHRHHGGPDGRYAHGPALAQDRDGCPADGSRVHYQRHSAPNCPDNCPPWRRSRRRDHQGVPRRRPRPGL